MHQVPTHGICVPYFQSCQNNYKTNQSILDAQILKDMATKEKDHSKSPSESKAPFLRLFAESIFTQVGGYPITQQI